MFKIIDKNEHISRKHKEIGRSHFGTNSIKTEKYPPSESCSSHTHNVPWENLSYFTHTCTTCSLLRNQLSFLESLIKKQRYDPKCKKNF